MTKHFDVGTRLPTLEGERVALRWLTEADVPALYTIFSDPDVCRYWSSPPMGSIEDAKRLLKEIHQCFRERSLFQWGIARLDDDHVIGTCTLADLHPVHRRAEVGFALEKASWGQGLVREVLPLVFTFAFDTLDLHRIEADIDPANTPSIRIVESFGFQREGYLRERYHVGDIIQDALMYGLLRSDWEKR
ncbi:MAG: GNAT family N-acetyltransferase [Candidatus Krumholzibacteriota bacterium]|nr:GNAT family N-acetyltransferase [Candidatus Krumholzibacteriota bacterium]